MAALVSKLKDKIHRRSDSADSSTSPVDGVATQAATPASPRTETRSRGSLEHSAFHVTRGGGVRTSISDNQGQHASNNANDIDGGRQTVRAVNSDHPHASNGQQGASGLSSINADAPVGQARHKRNISRQEQQVVVDGTVPERDSSKYAVNGQPAQNYSGPGSQFVDTDGMTTHQRRPSRSAVPDFSKPDRRQLRISNPNGNHETSSPVASLGNEQNGNGVQYTEAASPRRKQVAPRDGALSQPGLAESLSFPPRKESLQLDHAQLPNHQNPQHGIESKSKRLPSLPNKQNMSQRSQTQESLATNALLAQEYVDTTHKTEVAEQQKARAIGSGHLKLPSDFDLRSTEETHVIEEQRPAVTHETIVKQRIEIIQEEITREIHVHHYYTYLQPIKVIEMLPARHYLLDLQTGTRSPIPAPPGWHMPVNTAPSLPDTSMVHGWTRHYLVDNEHPNGILEPAPPALKHEQAHNDLREEAVAQQN